MYEVEAERALLQMLTFENEFAEELGPLAHHPEWMSAENRLAADVVFEFLRVGKPVDMTLAEAEMRRRDPEREHYHDSFAGSPGAFASDYARLYAEAITRAAEERHTYHWTQKLMIAANRFAGAGELRAILDEQEADLAQFRGGPAAQVAAQSARDLAAKDIPAPKWAVRGLFAEGLTILAGGPKRGKSALALQVLLAVAYGGRALGSIPVECGEALYLALEDNERRMQSRMERLLEGDQGAPDGLYFAYDWPRIGEGGIEKLDAWLDQHPATRLVVVDTIKRIKPAQANRNATLYDADYDAIQPLQTWAIRRGVALVVVHHTRKASADAAIDEVSGSTGLTGAADNIVVMRRSEQTAELHRVGRDYEDDAVWGLRGDASSLRWTLEGTVVEMRRSDARQEIIDALAKAYPACLGSAEVAEATGRNRATVRVHLSNMIAAGDPSIERIGSLYCFKPKQGKQDEHPKQAKQAKQVPEEPTLFRPVYGQHNDPKQAAAPDVAEPEASPVYAVYPVYGASQPSQCPEREDGGPHEFQRMNRHAFVRVCKHCGEPEPNKALGGYSPPAS